MNADKLPPGPYEKKYTDEEALEIAGLAIVKGVIHSRAIVSNMIVTDPKNPMLQALRDDLSDMVADIQKDFGVKVQ